MVSGLGRRGDDSDQAMDVCPLASSPLRRRLLRCRCEACGVVMFRSQLTPFVFHGGGSCRGWMLFQRLLEDCRMAVLFFFIDNVDWRWWIRGSSCTGLTPCRRATEICAPPATVVAFFGSQSCEAMVRRRLFGKRILSSLLSACSPAALVVGGRRGFRSAFPPRGTWL